MNVYCARINHDIIEQITPCNSLVNKDKPNNYRNLISKNVHDLKELWQIILSTLHSVPETVLPSDDTQKCLAYHFVTFFSDKITKIRAAFFQLIPIYLSSDTP